MQNDSIVLNIPNPSDLASAKKLGVKGSAESLRKKLPRNRRVRLGDMNVVVSVTDRSERDLVKQFDGSPPPESHQVRRTGCHSADPR